MLWTLYPQERPGTHCTGGWVGLGAGLDGTENLTLTGFDPRTFQPIMCCYTDYSILTAIQRYRAYFPGEKQPKCEVNHSPPSSAKVKNEWSYTPTPAICLHSVDTENFTVY
jgi:hypothetical protein